MGAISWIVDSLLYDEAIAVAEEEQRMREREATPEQREQDKEDGVDDQVSRQRGRSFPLFLRKLLLSVSRVGCWMRKVGHRLFLQFLVGFNGRSGKGFGDVAVPLPPPPPPSVALHHIASPVLNYTRRLVDQQPMR